MEIKGKFKKKKRRKVVWTEKRKKWGQKKIDEMGEKIKRKWVGIESLN